MCRVLFRLYPDTGGVMTQFSLYCCCFCFSVDIRTHGIPIERTHRQALLDNLENCLNLPSFSFVFLKCIHMWTSLPNLCKCFSISLQTLPQYYYRQISCVLTRFHSSFKYILVFRLIQFCKGCSNVKENICIILKRPNKSKSNGP